MSSPDGIRLLSEEDSLAAETAAHAGSPVEELPTDMLSPRPQSTVDRSEPGNGSTTTELAAMAKSKGNPFRSTLLGRPYPSPEDAKRESEPEDEDEEEDFGTSKLSAMFQTATRNQRDLDLMEGRREREDQQGAWGVEAEKQPEDWSGYDASQGTSTNLAEEERSTATPLPAPASKPKEPESGPKQSKSARKKKARAVKAAERKAERKELARANTSAYRKDQGKRSRVPFSMPNAEEMTGEAKDLISVAAIIDDLRALKDESADMMGALVRTQARFYHLMESTELLLEKYRDMLR